MILGILVFVVDINHLAGLIYGDQPFNSDSNKYEIVEDQMFTDIAFSA